MSGCLGPQRLSSVYILGPKYSGAQWTRRGGRGERYLYIERHREAHRRTSDLTRRPETNLP
jgi:hypothetical protein